MTNEEIVEKMAMLERFLNERITKLENTVRELPKININPPGVHMKGWWE